MSEKSHESIRNALSIYEWDRGVEYEAYLQGSYKNVTNVRGDSDVDLVVQMNSSFFYDVDNLPIEQQAAYRRDVPPATKTWFEFRDDVLKALRAYYGASRVRERSKCITVGTGYLPTDVVVCQQYRKYRRYLGASDFGNYVEGISFYVPLEDRWIVNYPKVHCDNGVDKNGFLRTRGMFKPLVRTIKNARNYMEERGLMIEDSAPSYFVECLAYNLPDELFGSRYEQCLPAFLKWFSSRDNIRSAVCQNEQLMLCGNTPEQWNDTEAVHLVGRLANLWENWGK